MNDDGYRTIGIIIMAVIMVLVLVNPFGTDVVYENINAETDMAETYVICDAPREQIKPDADGGWVVWQDFRNGNWDIYAYNMSDEMEYVVTNNVTPETDPKISGQHVVWLRNDGVNKYICGMFLNNRTWWEKNVNDVLDFDVFANRVFYVYGGEYLIYFDVFNPTSVANINLNGGGFGNFKTYQVYASSYIDCAIFYHEETEFLFGYLSLEGGGIRDINQGTFTTASISMDSIIAVMANSHVFVHQMSTGTTTNLASVGTPEWNPLIKKSTLIDINTDWVVWSNYSALDDSSQLVSYNLDNKEFENVTDSGEYGVEGVCLYGDYAYFTYEDENTNNADIYAVSLLGGTFTPEDTDGDGLPDDWEMEYFGNLDEDWDGDYDGDGYTNLEEFQAGTDPTDPDDFPPAPADPIQDNLTTIIIAIVGGSILVGIEMGYYKSEHLKKINKKVPLGIVASLIAIGLIVIYLII